MIIYFIILCYVKLYYVIFDYITLNYIILYYIILYFVILLCDTLNVHTPATTSFNWQQFLASFSETQGEGAQESSPFPNLLPENESVGKLILQHFHQAIEALFRFHAFEHVLKVLLAAGQNIGQTRLYQLKGEGRGHRK